MQGARQAVGYEGSLWVTQVDLVAGHRPARGAGAYLAGPVGQEDVQRLGGADAVDDLHAEAPGEPLLQRRRQRLSRRGAEPYRREGVLGQVGGEQRGVEGGYAEEQRRPVGGHALGGHGGVGRRGSSSVAAPAERGKNIELPMP